MTTQFDYTDAFTPNSSWVERVYYNMNSEVLAVVTQGRHYFYRDVPEHVFSSGEYANSTGTWYNDEVQGAFSPAAFSSTRNPTDPVNYVYVHNATKSGSQLVAPLSKNPDNLEYKILATFEVSGNVSAASLEAAIAEFKNNLAKYVKADVKGVQLIDS